MNIKYKNLKVRQLDNKFNSKSKLNNVVMPQQGWIKEIRTSLGMTQKQLAKRLGVTAPTIANYEKSEAEGRISLDTLKKVSGAMKCRLVYAIAPVTSLEKIIEEQTLKAAGKIFKKVSHSMKLEMQDLDKKENREQLNELIREINSKSQKKIWDYEV